MKKKEAKFSIKFRHWLKANIERTRISCTFEIKDTRGAKSLRFSELKEEQINWALAIKSKKGVLMRQQGGGGEPDYTYHYNQPAFVVINYPDGFVIIDIEVFVLERDRSKRKSLTWDRACAIAVIEEHYKKSG